MQITDALPSIEEARTLTIQRASDRTRAADLWDAIRAFRKQAEEQKETVCRPLKQAWEDAKKPFDAFIKECSHWESQLAARMAAWDAEQLRLAREAQAKLEAKAQAEYAKRLAKAEAKGLDTAQVQPKPVPVVPAPPASVETQAGTKQVRTVRKVYEPVDLASLMRDFPQLFVLDLAKFQALAKTGILDGRPDVRVREEFVYAQRR